VKTHTCENNNDNASRDLFKCITLFAQACIGAKKSCLFFFIVVGTDMGLMYYFVTFYKENECLCTFLFSDKID